MSEHNNQTTIKNSSAAGLLTRLFWMLLGNAILLISGVSILQYQDRGFHTADVIFWITTAVLIVVRYFDVKLWDGATCTGNPATMAHWRRYAVILLGCAGAIWAVLHLVVYFIHRG
jgi:hypothetical protein